LNLVPTRTPTTKGLWWSLVGIVAKEEPQEDQDVSKIGKDPNEAMQDKTISNIEERIKRNTHAKIIGLVQPNE
jgi:fatty-acid desaturase